MKKIITIGIFIIVVVSVTAYNYFNQMKTVSENGFLFSYPSVLTMERAYSEGSNYSGYNIKNSKQNIAPENSWITISIPHSDASGTAPFSEQIKNTPSYPPMINPITINGHKGEFIVMRSDADPRNSPMPHNQSTSIQLFTKYSTSPLLLLYLRYDSDPSLDQAWEMILKTLKY